MSNCASKIFFSRAAQWHVLSQLNALPRDMSSTSLDRPHVTVAGIIMRGDEVLLVEEHTQDGLRLNNPAGHLEVGESPEQGVIREVLEETACNFIPEALVGVYLSRTRRTQGAPQDVSYLRLAFCGSVSAPDPARQLDTGIVRTLWMNLDTLRAQAHRLRSPLVLRCAEDCLRGQRYPLDLLHTDRNIWTAESGN